MSQLFNKRLYSIKQLYKFIEDNYKTVNSKIKSPIDRGFSERIMLAVTEVNGCELCCYAHTKSALRSGLTDSEIDSMLTGDMDSVPVDERVAILFAQHYADTAGNYSEESLSRVLDSYGNDRTLSILGSIRSIMVGNTVGIALGAFKDRLKGEPVKKSSLLYELSILFCVVPFLIFAGLKTLYISITERY